MKLWIGNIAPGTGDDELKAFLARYGIDTVVAIERVEGDGTRPAAMLEVVATSDALGKATLRLSGLYWKGRSLNVQAMTR
jgi:hypothetical protein